MFFSPKSNKKGVQSQTFGDVRCGLYIVNNGSGAQSATLGKKVILEAPGPPFYLPVALHFGAFGAPLGALLRTFAPLGAASAHPFAHGAAEVRFGWILGSPGSPKALSAAQAQRSGG